MSRHERAKLVNPYLPDPLTNRVITDECWDGLHANKRTVDRCTGWMPRCEDCEDNKDHTRPNYKCECDCHTVRCDCECHQDYPQYRKPKRDVSTNLNLLDYCEPIEIK